MRPILDKLNSSGFLNFLSLAVVVAVGLLIGLIVLLITDAGQAFPAIWIVLSFGFSSLRNFGDVLYFATPIIMTGLSVGFAYKTGLFNIGASGQFTFGAFAAVYVVLEWDFLPPAIRIIVALVLAAVLGGIWGAIPGLLKAYRNVHEVISCIMTNYIGMFLVRYMILNSIFDPMRGATLRVPPDGHLPAWGLDLIFRDAVRASTINASIVIAILAAAIMYILLERTTFGYELKACGFNRDAAKYAGINERRSVILSMMISGSLAGLGGGMFFLSAAGRSINIAEVLAMEGFMGISVSLLGMNHPIGIVFSGILVAFLQRGGFNIQPLGFAHEIIEIVIAVIIYFCAFVLLVRTHLSGITGRLGFRSDSSNKSNSSNSANRAKAENRPKGKRGESP